MIIIGFILLIIPGFIMIRRYFFAPFVMLDKDVSITEAMRRSSKMTKPYTWQIWPIIGVFILLSLPSAVPVIGGIIAIALGMFYSVAPALRYQEIKQP